VADKLTGKLRKLGRLNYIDKSATIGYKSLLWKADFSLRTKKADGNYVQSDATDRWR